MFGIHHCFITGVHNSCSGFITASSLVFIIHVRDSSLIHHWGSEFMFGIHISRSGFITGVQKSCSGFITASSLGFRNHVRASWLGFIFHVQVCGCGGVSGLWWENIDNSARLCPIYFILSAMRCSFLFLILYNQEQRAAAEKNGCIRLNPFFFIKKRKFDNLNMSLLGEFASDFLDV